MALALLFLARPMDGFALALAIGGVWLYRIRRQHPRPGLFAFWTTAVLGPLVFVAANVAAGYHLAELPMDTYFEHYEGASNRLGFGSDRGTAFSTKIGPGHSMGQAVANLQRHLYSADKNAFSLPGGAILFFAIGALSVGEMRRTPELWWLAAATVVGYGLYWYHGAIPAGPRFYFVLLPLMVLLCRQGLTTLSKALGAAPEPFLAAYLLVGLAIHLVTTGLGSCLRPPAISADQLRMDLERSISSPAIVLIPPETPARLRVPLLSANDLGLANPMLFAQSRGLQEDVDQLRERLPGRRITCLATDGITWRSVTCGAQP